VKGQNYADVIRRFARQTRVEAPPSLPPDKRRLVSAVEQALRARARRRLVVRRGVGVTFAVAAALALVIGSGRLKRADAPIVSESAGAARAGRALTVLGTGDAAPGAAVEGAKPPISLKRGMSIGVGLTLRAPAAGEVRVGTADGTSLTLEAGGDLTFTESGATQRFSLRAGAVSAHVSRLFAGERFVVDTSDAEVEVHGTAFRVAVVPADAACGDGSMTRVSVLEGIVRVRAAGHEISLAPGGQWPSGCDAQPGRAERPFAHLHAARDHLRPEEHAKAAARERPAAEPVAATTVVERPPVAPPTGPTSSLAAENDLFAAAVHAKKQGRLDDAARLFGQLVASHPGSPLVESALVQRMKILGAIDPAAGVRAATDYLERFPSGFARPEAQALAGRPGP
jgi:hypothetical protein